MPVLCPPLVRFPTSWEWFARSVEGAETEQPKQRPARRQHHVFLSDRPHASALAAAKFSHERVWWGVRWWLRWREEAHARKGTCVAEHLPNCPCRGRRGQWAGRLFVKSVLGTAASVGCSLAAAFEWQEQLFLP